MRKNLGMKKVKGELAEEKLLKVADYRLSGASGSGETTPTNSVLHGRWDGKYSDGPTPT